MKSTSNVCIIKLGNSNCKGIRKILIESGYEVSIVEKKTDLKSFSHLILPGVGSFDHGINSLRVNEFEQSILDFSKEGKPILGICLGMHLLGLGSDEGTFNGLGLYSARFKSLNSADLPIPHVGFNSVEMKGYLPILETLNGNQFYFNHTFAFVDELNANVGITQYGQSFVSVISSENIHGVQFHPEKSYKAGKKLFDNFIKSN